MPQTSKDPEQIISQLTPEQRQRMSREHRTRIKTFQVILQRTWYQVTSIYIWVIALQFIALYFFTRGFLLSRPVLDNHSTCLDIPLLLDQDNTDSKPIFPDFDFNSYTKSIDYDDEDGCWYPKSFNRAVLLVVDALRFDFAVPGPKSSKYYLNNMPFMYETAMKNPKNALLLKFLADPPTTTLQRLKGLTTGSLPTFIDAGSNFAGTEILEDSWVAQFASIHDKSIAFTGDDTWVALFSHLFNESMSYPYESLNVMDLHTVDNGVKSDLIPFLDSEDLSDNWKLAIGHMLGVDHAGHRYGPEHPAMADKQKETDAFIRSVAEKIDDDTLLIVMGDHGMDPRGDHGGESLPELESTLWMYSKRPSFGRLPDANKTIYNDAAYGKNFRSVGQIDLVPTISLLLGIPIPYNNLGFPIAEAFLGPSSIDTPEDIDYTNLARTQLLTAAQIRRYSLIDGSLSNINSVNILWKKLLSLVSLSTLDSPNAHNISLAAAAYHKQVLEEYRTLWVKFDTVSMNVGLVLMAFSAFIIYTYARIMPTEMDGMTNPILMAVTTSASTFGSIVFMLSRLASSKTIESAEEGTTLSDYLPSIVRLPLHALLIGVAFGVVVGFMGVFGSIFLRGASLKSLYSMFIAPKSTAGALALVLTFAHAALFASNSYTVWEDSSLLFLLATFGLYLLVTSLRSKSKTSELFALNSENADESDTPSNSHKHPNAAILTSTDFEQKASDDKRKVMALYFSIAFLVVLRIVSYSKICREEQGVFCKTTFYINENSTVSSWVSVGLLAFASLYLPTVIASFYQTSASMHGAAPGWITYGLRAIMLAIFAYWAMDAVDARHYITDTWGLEQLKTMKLTVARIVLGITLVVANIFWWISSLCVGVEMSQSPATSSEKPNQNAPKGIVQAKILGYSNIYGSMIMLAVLNIFATTLIVSKPMAGLSLCALIFQILALLELFDIFETSLYFSSLGPVAFGLLGSFHFFTTGHQATIPSIQWDISYIPAESIIFPITHLALVFNTFSSQILVALAVPLLVLWKIPPSKTPSPLLQLAGRTGFSLILYQTVITLSAMFFAMHFRRHLMVWKIFAPRFMLAAMSLIVTNVFVFLGVVVIAGHSIKYVNKVFNT